MRINLIILGILSTLFICCGTYKTQYYIHDVNYFSTETIDSINRVHQINIPLSLEDMSKTFLKGQSVYTMYHYMEFRKDTMFVFSITIPEDEQRYIIKLRKEVNHVEK